MGMSFYAPKNSKKMVSKKFIDYWLESAAAENDTMVFKEG